MTQSLSLIVYELAGQNFKIKYMYDYNFFMLGEKLHPHCSSSIALTLTSSSQRKQLKDVGSVLDRCHLKLLPLIIRVLEV